MQEKQLLGGVLAIESARRADLGDHVVVDHAVQPAVAFWRPALELGLQHFPRQVVQDQAPGPTGHHGLARQPVRHPGGVAADGPFQQVLRRAPGPGAGCQPDGVSLAGSRADHNLEPEYLRAVVVCSRFVPAAAPTFHGVLRNAGRFRGTRLS